MKTIKIYLDGGLGNQLFQYAFGRARADEQGLELVLDVSMLNRCIPSVTPRNFSLYAFDIRARIENLELPWHNLLIRIFRIMPWLSNKFRVRVECSADYDHDANLDCRSKYFIGYWQSPKYFTNQAARLFHDLQPLELLSVFTQTFIDSLIPAQSVMIHVRRGDYVSLTSAVIHHGVLDLNYYKKAVAQCLETRPDVKFYVFSDDIFWCRDNEIVGNAPVTYVGNDPSRSDWEDLWMMSCCGHQIIANSSFSWWAAWLADQRYGKENRLVFAPKRWFRNTETKMEDRFPKHWKLL